MTAASERAVAVLATASLVVEHEVDRSLEEMIFDTVSNVLDRARMTPSDIDSIVVSGNDEIDGRVISIMPSSGAAGGVGRDITMIASSADHALIYGHLRVLAGQGDRVLVVGWAKPSESVSPERAELMGAEPYLLRNIGMNETLAAALQASTWTGSDQSIQGKVLAWPLTASDLPARGDSVYAVILAPEGTFEAGAEVAWVIGSGWATQGYELGQRDVSAFSGLASSIEQLVESAPEASPRAWARAEIAAPSEFAVERVAELLGLDPTVTNVSGGLAQVRTSPFVSGLARMVAAIDSLRSDDAAPQKLVAGIGFHGFASQGTSVMVFGSRKAA